MKLSKIKNNPDNPRLIRDEKFTQLVNSILSLPKMLRLREIVLNNQGECESQAGNMRAEALRFIAKFSAPELIERVNALPISDERKAESVAVFSRIIKTREIPHEWIKYADDFTADELREFIIKDNNNFGEWNFDALGNLFDLGELENWGLDFPELAKPIEIDIDDFFNQIEPAANLETSKNQIVLEYTAEEHARVKAALAEISPSASQAVRSLLGL